MNEFLNMLSYPFMARAFIVGTLISLCAALLGVSLVLKRYAMIGDGLSHVGFGALAIAAVLNISPLTFALPVVVLAAFLLLRLNESAKIRGDSAIALISTGALALGVFVLSMSEGMNTNVNNYLFGSILALRSEDLPLTIAMTLAVLVIYSLSYHRIFSVTFDESFAKATGLATNFYNLLIAIMTAVVIVLGMQMMGALLMSAMVVFPALSAMRLSNTYKKVSILAAIISLSCLWIGLTMSYFWSTPSGASVVICNIVVFILAWIYEKIKTR